MADFNEFATELFEGMGAVKARRMFGGAGLYLKTDEALASALIAEGAEPWVYEKNPTAKHTYYRLPLDAMDDPDEAARWARRRTPSQRR